MLNIAHVRQTHL